MTLLDLFKPRKLKSQATDPAETVEAGSLVLYAKSGGLFKKTASGISLIEKPVNYIINGGFDFWQRAITTPVGAIAANGAYITADRWKFTSTSNANTYVSNMGAFEQYATVPSTSKYGLNFYAVGTTTGQFMAAHYIEAVACLSMIGATQTLSFKVKRLGNTINANKPLVVSVYTLNSLDTSLSDIRQGTGGTIIGSPVTVITDLANASNSTWVTYSLTFNVPAGAVNGLGITFVLGTVSTTFSAAGSMVALCEVMLNEGSVAAPFSRAGGTYAQEELLVKRYYNKYSNTVTTSTLIAHTQSTSFLRMTIFTPVPMRTQPTIVGTWGATTVPSSIPITSPSVVQNSGNMVTIEATATAVTGIYFAYLTQPLELSAEL
jgi:hypothetical protein